MTHYKKTKDHIDTLIANGQLSDILMVMVGNAERPVSLTSTIRSIPAKEGKMAKAIIHVNRQHIAMNAKDGGNRPVYTIKNRGTTRYAREVKIQGPSRLVYDGRQLKCGARAWIETDADVELVDEMSFAEARGK